MATMPSSPPRRIHSRHSSHSSNSSQYSLDLDALMPPDEHDSSSLAIQQPKKHAIDVVDSEDIDGPTDFTQNMEYWMSTKLPTVVEPTRLEGAPKKDMEEYVGSDDTQSTTKHVSMKRIDSLETSPHLPPHDEFDPDKSIVSVTTPRRAYEGGLSDSFFSKIPHGDESTPRTVEPASPLDRPATRQATVEDYEDTPLRLIGLASAAISSLDAPSRSPELTPRGKPTPRTSKEAPAAPSETEKSLEIALNQLREELASVRAQVQEQQHRQGQEHEERLANERTSHEQDMKQMEKSWQSKFTESNTSYETKLTLLQSQAGDASVSQAQQLDKLECQIKHGRELDEQKEARIRNLEARIVDQDEKLEEAKREIVTLGRELESMEEKYRGAHEDLLEERTENHLHSQSIQSNYDKLAADKYDADVRIEALETELAKVKEEESILQKNHDVLQVNTVKLEETVKDLEIQVERATDDHVQELQRTHGILQAHHARLEETVKGLEEQVKHATDDHVQKPSVSETGSEETVTPAGEYLKHEKQRLENELETARIDHVLELSVLEAEAEQAVINARESLQIKLENLKEENATLRTKSAEKDTELQRLQEQLQDHFQEVSVLEAEAEETVTNARDSFSREKERLETELEITKDENATLRTEAAEIDKELQRLRFKLQDQSSTQIEMLTKERDLLISKFKEQKTKYAKSHSESQSTITTLQTRVNDLTTTNATINTSLKSTTKDLSKTRQLVKIAEFETKAALREKQKVSTEFEMMKKKTEAINAGFDKGVEEMMKARNEEWRRKYEALKKERGVMSKVLMKEWGEKECGAMEPCQGYRYKYI